MEIDKERSTITQDDETIDARNDELLKKRQYLKSCKLPSGLSVELPPP